MLLPSIPVGGSIVSASCASSLHSQTALKRGLLRPSPPSHRHTVIGLGAPWRCGLPGVQHCSQPSGREHSAGQ